MDLRGALFGSKLRIAVVAVVVLVGGVAGAYFAGILGVPSVENVENQFGTVNESTTEIRTELTVNNPNPIGIRLGGLRVDYGVAMNGVQMASGEKNGVGIGTGNSTVALQTYLQNDRIPQWWVTHVNRGETTALTVDATVKSSTLGRSASFSPVNRTIETDILGQFNSSEDQPVNASVPLVEDPILIIEERNASWGEATAQRTPIDMSFDVYNPKNNPVVVSNVGYNITMNGIDVGSGETGERVEIPPKATETLPIPTEMRTQSLDDWWVSHLQNEQVTNLTIDFYVEVSPPGSDETFRVPLEDATYTKTIETDFFGNKDASDSAADTDDSESDTGSEDTATTTTTTSGDSNDTTTTTTTTTTQSDDTGNDTTTTDDDLVDRERVTG